MELVIALGLVLILGGWICVLKKQVSDLSDRIAIMEAEREAKSPRSKRADTGDEKPGPGIATFTIE
jgi:hypothetical protein